MVRHCLKCKYPLTKMIGTPKADFHCIKCNRYYVDNPMNSKSKYNRLSGQWGWAYGKCIECGRRFKGDAIQSRSGRIVTYDLCATCQDAKKERYEHELRGQGDPESISTSIKPNVAPMAIAAVAPAVEGIAKSEGGHELLGEKGAGGVVGKAGSAVLGPESGLGASLGAFGKIASTAGESAAKIGGAVASKIAKKIEGGTPEPNPADNLSRNRRRRMRKKVTTPIPDSNPPFRTQESIGIPGKWDVIDRDGKKIVEGEGYTVASSIGYALNSPETELEPCNTRKSEAPYKRNPDISELNGSALWLLFGFRDEIMQRDYEDGWWTEERVGAIILDGYAGNWEPPTPEQLHKMATEVLSYIHDIKGWRVVKHKEQSQNAPPVACPNLLPEIGGSEK